MLLRGFFCGLLTGYFPPFTDQGQHSTHLLLTNTLLPVSFDKNLKP